MRPCVPLAFVVLVVLAASPALQARPLQSADYLRVRSAGDARISPDGSRIAYTVSTNDGPGRPRKQLFVMTVADGALGADRRRGGGVRSRMVARRPMARLQRRRLRQEGPRGRASRRQRRALPGRGRGHEQPAHLRGPRHRLVARRPAPGLRLGRPRARRPRLASGDPMVITRYLYKPDASEGLTRFNDNRRRHIFLVDLESGAVSPLTEGRPRGALHRLVAGRARDRLRLERGARSGPVLQPRPLRHPRGGRRGPAGDRHGERRVPAALVARRPQPGLPGDPAGPHGPRDHHGGYPRVGRERRRQRPPRARRARRQPAGLGHLVAGRPVRLLHRPGARQRALVPASPRRPARDGDRGRRAHRRLLDRAHGSGRVHPDESERPAPALSHRPGLRRQGRSPNRDGRHGPCAAPADRPERGAS